MGRRKDGKVPKKYELEGDNYLNGRIVYDHSSLLILATKALRKLFEHPCGSEVAVYKGFNIQGLHFLHKQYIFEGPSKCVCCVEM